MQKRILLSIVFVLVRFFGNNGARTGQLEDAATAGAEDRA